MKTIVAKHEAEISLRLTFENKLNNMHSAFRIIEQKYKRACAEIDELNENLETVTDMCDEQRL